MNPWAENLERHSWEQRLRAIDERAQISIAAACLVRPASVYLAWAHQYDPEGERVAREGLDELWDFVAGREHSGSVYERLCDHDPERSDTPLDEASPNGWEALRTALLATLVTDSTDHVVDSLGASYASVERPIIRDLHGSLASELDPQLAKDARVRREIEYQEAVLSEVERSGRPMTKERAGELSALHLSGDRSIP